MRRFRARRRGRKSGFESKAAGGGIAPERPKSAICSSVALDAADRLDTLMRLRSPVAQLVERAAVNR